MSENVWVLVVEDNEHLAWEYASVFWEMLLEPEICQHLDCANKVINELLSKHEKVIVVLDEQFPDTEETLKSENWMPLTPSKWSHNWSAFINDLAPILEDTQKKVLILANSSNSSHNIKVVELVEANSVSYSASMTWSPTNKNDDLIREDAENFVNN